MDDLDQVLEALANLEAAEGLAAVNELLGRDLTNGIRNLRRIPRAGDLTAREVVLKIGKLCWQKGSHKGSITE